MPPNLLVKLQLGLIGILLTQFVSGVFPGSVFSHFQHRFQGLIFLIQRFLIVCHGCTVLMFLISSPDVLESDTEDWTTSGHVQEKGLLWNPMELLHFVSLGCRCECA